MDLGNINDNTSIYKQLNSIVILAIEQHKQNILSDEEFYKILTQVENEINKVNAKKVENKFKDFLFKLIN